MNRAVKLIGGSVILLVLSSFIFLLSPQVEVSLGETCTTEIIVAKSGGDFSKIQEAIDNASNDAAISIMPGTYIENIVIDKSLSLVGTDRNAVFIQGSDDGHTVTIDSEDVLVSNISITGSSDSEFDSAVYSSYNRTSIQHCNLRSHANGIIFDSVHTGIIQNNTVSMNNFLGVMIKNSQSIEVYDNRVESTTMDYGIEIRKSHNLILCRNDLINNGRAGIYMQSCNDAYIENNTIERNKNGAIINYCMTTSFLNNTLNDNVNDGFQISSSDNNHISNNVISNTTSRHGLYLTVNSNHNIIANNTITHNKQYGILITDSSTNNTVYNNTFYGNNEDRVEASDEVGSNKWDNGAIGNHWAEWTSPDNNGDGIVDAPYPIDGGMNARDRFPLTVPPQGTDPDIRPDTNATLHTTDNEYPFDSNPRLMIVGAIPIFTILFILIAVIVHKNEVLLVLFYKILTACYSRIQRDELLNHKTRSRIYGAICSQPAITYSDLKHTYDLRNGTLTHHIVKLEKEKLIKSVNRGKKVHYFDVRIKYPDKYVHLTSQQSIIHSTVVKKPGISQADIGRETGMSAQKVNYHVKRLKKKGMIIIEIEGRRSECYDCSNRRR